MWRFACVQRRGWDIMGRVKMPPFDPDEKTVGYQYAGLVDRYGVVTKGELVATARRLLFLANGWRRPGYRPPLDLAWGQLDSITAYPVKRASHLFIRSAHGDEWRFWATALNHGFTYLALRAVNVVEVEENVWKPAPEGKPS